MNRPDGGSGQSSDSGSSTTPTLPPAEQALADLPRAAALPATALVTVRDTGGNVDLYAVDTATGQTGARLTSGPAQDIGPLLSKDRATVVYQQVADGEAELRTVAVDGSGDRPLFADPLDCPNPDRPAWNPVDQTQLAVACATGDGRALRLITLDGATVRALDAGLPHTGDLSFSPDGSRVLYWANDAGVDGGELYALPTDGSAGPQRLTARGPGVDADAVWSPDGTRIVFRRVTAPNESRIVVMNADGSGQQQLTSGSGVDQDPIWSPDGSMIAFKSNRAGAAEPPGDHVWVMQADGSGRRQLDDEGGTATNAPAWGNR
jgi:Tol biopolymer transport system component